jgi:hypothetical protein
MEAPGLAGVFMGSVKDFISHNPIPLFVVLFDGILACH